MNVDKLTCPNCDAQFHFDEKIGTTCRYVDYCPSCGSEVAHDCWETIPV